MIRTSAIGLHQPRCSRRSRGRRGRSSLLPRSPSRNLRSCPSKDARSPSASRIARSSRKYGRVASGVPTGGMAISPVRCSDAQRGDALRERRRPRADRRRSSAARRRCSPAAARPAACPAAPPRARCFSASASESTVWITSKSRTASFALFDCRCPMRCQRAAPRTSGFLSRASCTRFSPTSVDARGDRFIDVGGGKGLRHRDERDVFARAAGALAGARRCAPRRRRRSSRIASRRRIDPSLIRTCPSARSTRDVRQAVGVLVAGAQRVADREARGSARVIDFARCVAAERDSDASRGTCRASAARAAASRRRSRRSVAPSDLRRRQRLEQAGVLRDVVGGRAEEAGRSR